jgi:hypothetical protein
MRFRLALALIVLAGLYAEAPAQGLWYWCETTRAYSPYVTTCSVPWRPVAPRPYAPMTQPAPGVWPTPPSSPPPSIPVAEPTDAYRQGVADWQSQQAWFDSQSGDRLAGANYWAANRNNKAGHKSCEEAGSNFSRNKTDFITGCQNAKQRLDPIDAKRSDPQYWAGFNDGAEQPPLSVSAAPPPNQGVRATQPAPPPTQQEPPPTAAPSPAAANHFPPINPVWKRMGESNSGMIEYVDMADIRRTGAVSTVWIMQNYEGKEEFGPAFRSVIFQSEYDCNSHLTRAWYYATFSNHMGQGTVLDGGPLPVDDRLRNWQPIPESQNGLAAIACNTAAPASPPQAAAPPAALSPPAPQDCAGSPDPGACWRETTKASVANFYANCQKDLGLGQSSHCSAKVGYCLDYAMRKAAAESLRSKYDEAVNSLVNMCLASKEF